MELPWEKLSGCNILVTGATGLIGGCLVDVLLAHPGADYHVYASGRNEQRAMERFARHASNPHFHFIQHDVTQSLNSDTPFHYIIHAASNASPNFFAQHPVDVMRANFDGVANLLDYGIRHAMRRMLYVSTGEVYGEGNGEPFSETSSGYVDCATPRACYPSSKRAAETLCIAYTQQYGVDVVIGRPCHVYGPGFTEQDNRVYAQFLRNVLHGEDIVMKSRGEQFRSWCYIADCVSALLHILLCGATATPYNIADPDANISIRTLAETIATLAGRSVIIQLPEGEASPNDERRGYNPVTRSTFVTERLQSLGWRPLPGTLRDKFHRTLEELKQRISAD